MDVEIVVCPIVRESDGLAMSSRNAYLNPEQRQQALVLSRSLLEVKAAVDAGERDVGMLAEIGRRAIASEPAAKLDYLAIVDPDTLDPIDKVSKGTLIAVAVWLGTTRLIDNILL
jgi:pantoate--beta-alanine ligase